MPVHMMAGAIIDKASRRWYLTIPFAFASHFFLDSFNYGKYTLFHGPMDAELTGAVISISIILSIFLAIKAKKYWLGMLFGVLPDFEWALFFITGWNCTQGLHHKWFWPTWFATEWGLIMQLVIFAFLFIFLFVPRKQTDKIVKPVEDKAVMVIRKLVSEKLGKITSLVHKGGNNEGWSEG